MQPFLHHQQQQLDRFLSKLIGINDAFIRKKYATDDDLADWLASVEQFFTESQATTKSAEISALKVRLATAQQGIDPEKLTKLRTGRRELTTINTYHVLSEANRLVVTQAEEINAKLQLGKDQLDQLLLSVLQTGIIDEAQLQLVTNKDAAAGLWNAIARDNRSALIARKIKMSLSDHDIHLLLLDAMNRMQPPN